MTLINASLAILTVLANSLDHSTDFSVELFINRCNLIRDVYYSECRWDTLNETEVIVYSNHLKTEGRIDEFVEKVWIFYLCQATGCLSQHKSIGFSEKRTYDLLLEPSPKPSRMLLPLFPYRTVMYSIYVRKPDRRVRLFAFYYIFSPTLWIVLLSSLALISLATLLIRRMLSRFSPVQDALQSLYNLFANNGSTDGFYGSNSSRIVYIVGSTLILIFWVSFSTFLIAELSVSQPDRLRGDLRLLLTNRKLKAICVEPNSAVHAHLLFTIPTLVNIHPCPTTWPNWGPLFKEVCNSEASKIAFVESSSFLEEYRFFHHWRPSLPCNFSSIMDNLFQLPKSIITRRGFPLKEQIGQLFFKMAERGVAQLVAKQVFSVLDRKLSPEETIQEGYLEISMRHLAITFAVLGVGIGLAGVIFSLEVIAHIGRQRRNNCKQSRQ